MSNSKLIYRDLRLEYSSRGLRRHELNKDPYIQFSEWFEVARTNGKIEPNAFFLATATPSGSPSGRIVLMKHFDSQGLCFFTNTGSRKAQNLAANPQASATFWWENLERQVHIEGLIEPLNSSTVTDYFHSRPRQSQLAAWASQQSTSISSKEVLQQSFEKYQAQFAEQTVPVPPCWGGYRLLPQKFEFWQGSAARLHDRFVYNLIDGYWHITRLAP
jgi:pyridoxamine 5'-phosphate oxidase